MENSDFLLDKKTINKDALRCGFVGFLGRPNAGKSTLLNTLVGEKIAAVSDKPQTTRTRIQGIITQPEGQIIFVDTPGVHKPGYKLNKRMMQFVLDTLDSVDVLLLIRDASVSTGNGDRYVLNLAKQAKCPVVLLLNKTDKIEEKEHLLSLIDFYRNECEFKEVFPISALKKDNTDLLIKELFKYLPISPTLLFPDDELTNQSERILVAEIIREQILNLLSDELPFVTAVIPERWKLQPNGVLSLAYAIYVERESQRKIVVGQQGKRIKDIGTRARYNIEKMVDSKVFLELFVKVQPHWRNNDKILDLISATN